jgi:hypothetical protein
LLSAEDGRIDDGVALMELSLATYAGREMVDQEARASALLARTRLDAGQREGAHAACARAVELLPRCQGASIRLAVAIAAACVAAADGEVESAVHQLEAAVDDARRRELVPMECEATLALGRVERAAGKADAARQRLDALARYATEKGLVHLARKAAAEAR